MASEVTFEEMRMNWIDFHQHLMVKDAAGEVLYNTNTKFVSPRLSESQVQSLQEYYIKNRRQYVF